MQSVPLNLATSTQYDSLESGGLEIAGAPKSRLPTVAALATVGVLALGSFWISFSPERTSLLAKVTTGAARPVLTAKADRPKANVPLKVAPKAKDAGVSLNDMEKRVASAALGVLAAGTLGQQPAQAALPLVPPPTEQVQPAAAQNNIQLPNAPPLTNFKDNGVPIGNQWKYSDFRNLVKAGKVDRVRFEPTGLGLKAQAFDGSRGDVQIPNDPNLITFLQENGVDISISEPNANGGGNPLSILGGLLNLALPVLFLFLIFRGLSGGNQQQGGGGGGMPGAPGGMNPFDFGKSKANFNEEAETGVMFEDVAGVDGAKLELMEVVDFLKNPEKYTNLGAKIPKGCLLVGPPGTGKTLLAKAVAGEAGVPFFSCAASEFVEMFVGVGASRVRDLFAKAKEKAPCIIFIDEIDAVGRQRGAGMGGGNDEREQTINQLLTEMDGFEGNTGVIILAATNRPDVLDQALLRPGRFDRQVTVDRPDLEGRVKVLGVHSRGKKLADDVDLRTVARRCPGFTGADLQNLMNEAAILTARRGKSETTSEEIADALEKIVAGPEKEGAIMSDAKRRLVAYHEAGHALVGALMPEYDPVAKISIVPRGAAGGLTFFTPSEERLESGLYSRNYLENQMAVALGGRIAEELIFGDDNITTGASGDFQQVTRTARSMVTSLGFSDKVGQLSLGGQQGPTFLGSQMGQQGDYSKKTAALIDSEVKALVEVAYRRAKDLVQTNITSLHGIAESLLEKETIEGSDALKIIEENQGATYMKADNPEITIPYQSKSAVEAVEA